MSAAALTNDLLTREQAAAFIGLRPQTLAVWASTGRGNLPYIRIGRLARYRRADLERWLADRPVQGVGAADEQDGK